MFQQLCYSHREHQEAVDELKRKSERNRSLLEEENKKLQAEVDKVQYFGVNLISRYLTFEVAVKSYNYFSLDANSTI